MSQKNTIHRKILSIQKFFHYRQRILALKGALIVVCLLLGSITSSYFFFQGDFISLSMVVLTTVLLILVFGWCTQRSLRLRFKKLTHRVTRFDYERIRTYLDEQKTHYDFHNAKKFRRKINQNSRFHCLLLQYREMSEAYYARRYK